MSKKKAEPVAAVVPAAVQVEGGEAGPSFGTEAEAKAYIKAKNNADALRAVAPGEFPQMVFKSKGKEQAIAKDPAELKDLLQAGWETGDKLQGKA